MFFLHRHYILSIFAYATTPFFICTHPGKSWLRFMFSCTNRWFFAQALHPVYFCIMVGLFARIQAKVGLDPCLVAQESVLLCRDHIQLYLLLHVPSSFNYGEDRRRFVADPEGKGRGKWRRMIWRLEGSYLMLLPAMALYSLFLELKLFWPISSPSFALPWQLCRVWI